MGNKDGSFSQAVKLGTTAAERRSLEWAARAQPTTWLPACDADQWPTPSGAASYV